MGTTGVYKSVSATKEMIVSDFNFRDETVSSEVLKTSSYGNQFWILRKIQIEGKELFVTADVILISHKEGMTYYKELNIECGPYYYHCPLSWLELITVVGDSVDNWKDSVRKYWAKKGIEIVPGMKLNFRNNSYIVVEKYTSHFWTVRRQDGKLFKMKNEFVKDSIVWGECKENV